jgi:crossover junction endodeoxyribonuclease RuvC
LVILGIDPGYAIVGFSVLKYEKHKFTTFAYGIISTSAEEAFENRLKYIYHDMNTIISKYKPECMAIEKLYFNTNQKTVINVAQARGVINLSAAINDLPIFEYTPLQVKQAVVGYGQAEKMQVMDMTRRILNLSEMPKPDDAADALAIAICHAHCAK